VIKTLSAAEKPAAERRKNAAHAVSRGSASKRGRAPKGRKKQASAALSDLRIIGIFLRDEIKTDDSIADKLLQSLRRHRLAFEPGDILVVKHKIVSKAEHRIVDLEMIKPSPQSIAWARKYKLDPRVIELAQRESHAIIRRRNGVFITETRHGFICANSGVDVSNVDGGHHALLLPADPDRSARKLHRELKKHTGFAIPVLVTDTFGRPWREGLVDFCIGIAGMKALRDDRGRRDPHGYTLHVSLEAVADELACAAALVCGKLNRTPACLIRGFSYQSARGRTRDLLRHPATDLFR
jgi:coenzyme F420-0:L-glutamate ligase/coenzyme F420-1:gamma-L-glutamate ligase